MAHIHVKVEDDLHRRFKAEMARRGTTITKHLRAIIRREVELADITYVWVNGWPEPQQNMHNAASKEKE